MQCASSCYFAHHAVELDVVELIIEKRFSGSVYLMGFRSADDMVWGMV